MNSEELEASLKAEFETHLTELFAELRQSTSQFQLNFESEFEKHKAHLDEAIKTLSDRFESDPKLDEALQQSIIEHLRLAKDSGAELAATAFDEAEKLRDSASSTEGFERVRDAIAEITSKSSQSTILTSLVGHAAEFAPRGVFFIVKNDHFVGWKRFGRDAADAAQISDVKFPIGDESVLAHAVQTLRTAQAGYSEGCSESNFLESLSLGQPSRMIAVPLTARGRGVAVLYVDGGLDNESVNIEALESIVRVAGVTVELLAASHLAQASASDANEQAATSRGQFAEQTETPAHPGATSDPSTESYQEIQDASEPYASDAAQPDYDGSATDHEAYGDGPRTDLSEEQVHVGVTEEPSESIDEIDQVQPVFVEPSVSTVAEAQANVPHYDADAVEFVEPDYAEADPNSTEFAFASEPDEVDVGRSEQHDTRISRPDYAVAETAANGYQTESAVVAPVEVAANVARSRYSERNMDLPIEVSEDERRVHNEARRFARLLVSEIKLYNEQKVSDGRESSDLYDRLREAIDRSREMYDKRVQPTVASKFDYFHFELVNNLAEGDERKMGSNFQGSSVP